MDNQVTRKLLTIKSFLNIYLLDNYYFKDLIIKIKWINFRIWVKNASRCNSWLRKSLTKKESKLNWNWKRGLASKRANRHSWSADRHMASADWHLPCANWPENPLIKIKPIYFKILGITTHSNSYLILFSLFFKHPTSINRGKTS